MRKLILTIVSVVIMITALSQTPAYLTELIGPFPAYKGQHANYKWPIVITFPPEALAYINGLTKVKPKCACSVDAHGIGERSSTYPSMSTYGTNDAYRLFHYGQPPNWQFTSSPYYNVKYSSPGKNENKCWIYVAFQVWQGDGYTYATYWRNTLRHMLTKYADVVDPYRVYITGLSLGAGGVMGVALQDDEVLDMIAGAWALMTGYDKVPSAQYNWKILKQKNWKGLIVVEHSTDDDVTTNGSQWSDRAVDSLLKYNGAYRVVYRRRTTGKHTVPVSDAWNPNRASINIPLSNGNTYNHLIPWQSILLTATNSGKRKD